MYHDQSFDSWWEENKEWYENHSITKQQFEDFRYKNGFTKGDIFVVLGTEKKDIEIGDIIIFEAGSNSRPIIHRVVTLEPLGTKGDNNYIQFSTKNNQEEGIYLGTPRAQANPEQIDETNILEYQIFF